LSDVVNYSKITNYCNETESINGVLQLFKKGFFQDYNELTAKEKKLALKAFPYIYRIWYHSSLITDTTLSPANFINIQVEDKFSEDCAPIVVPTLTPVYSGKALKDFKFEFKTYSIENHPVLGDIKLLLDTSLPDIGIDENGIILDEERKKFIDNLTFKEIYYVTYLTNIAYELKLFKKQPSIGVYRAAAHLPNVEAFFKLDTEAQFEKIVEATIKIASKQLCQIFIPDNKAFTISIIKDLLKNGLDLTDWIEKIMTKYDLFFNTSHLDGLDLDDLQSLPDDELTQKSLMALGINMELAFHMDICFTTPLGYYLQLIRPIYSYEFDFQSYFCDLYEAEQNNLPQIRLYFSMPQGFDLTPLGKKLFLNNNEPKNSYQKLVGELDFTKTYEDIVEYINSEIAIDEDFYENDVNDYMDNIFSAPPVPSSENRSKALFTAITPGQEIVTEKSSAYLFKIKKATNKRGSKTFALRGSQTLEKLAQAIILNFNMDYGHMYSFFMSNKPYDRSSEITCPYNAYSNINTESIKFHQLNLYKEQKFLFLYDFGDDIMFEVEFLGTEPAEKGVKYPILK
jgi:hypothetical protein